MATSVQELEAKDAAIVYDRNDRVAYREQRAAVTEELKAFLADEYAGNLSKAQTDIVFEKAWADGHANGFTEVEGHYVDLVEFIKNVIDEGR